MSSKTETEGLEKFDLEVFPVKSRLITGVIAVALLIAILLADSVVLKIAAFLANILVLYELYKATGIVKKGFLLILGFIPPFYVFLDKSLPLGLFLFFYVVALFVFLLANNKRIKLSDISKVFFLGFAITLMINYVAEVRTIDDIGHIAIWAVFIGSCLSDTFAYFTGVYFGKHKLAPVISPKKTIEGAIGAVLGTIVSFLVYGLIVIWSTDCSVNFLMMILMGAVCSVFAQLGDLSASIIKREYEIKDFGTVFPGHGGFLDRLDSILFVAPVVYLFFTHIPVITA